MKASLVIVFGLAVAGGACHPDMKERQAIDRWLLCEECTRGERDSVVAMRDRASDYLGMALRGPSPAQRENVRSQFAALDARLPDPLPGPFTRETFVAHYVDNFVASYQARAAIALGLINTPRAREILFEAFRTDTTSREDVLRAIGAAAPLRVDSSETVQSAPADSFVRVNPTLTVFDVRDVAAPRPIAGVPVVFRVASGGGTVMDSLQRTDANGRASTRWRLGPGIDSANLLVASTAGRDVSFRAVGRALNRRLVFVGQPGNVRVGDTLSLPVRVAVVDAWGVRDSTMPGSVEMFVVGTAMTWVRPLVGGEATFASLIFGVAGPAQRLLARVGGATQAISAPFDILP